jgi:two-component system sensor histidine kinase/response regulator
MNERPLKILIAADNPEDRLEIKRCLLLGENRPYQFIEAGTGAEAIQACLETPDGPPDCVFLDYHLPDYDAPDILASVLSPLGMPCCPVVVMTGLIPKETTRSVLEAGAQDFIGKDWINPESLARVLANAMERYALLAERRQMEESIRLSELRFRYAMEAASDGVWDWNLQTDEVYHSPGYAAMLGYAPEELAAQWSTGIDLLHPGDRETVLAKSRSLLRDPGHYELEFRMLHKDGGYRWILSRAKVVERDGQGLPIRAVGTHMDLTEKKRLESALQEERDRLAAVIDNLSEEIWLIDAEGRLLLVNPAARREFGLEDGGSGDIRQLAAHLEILRPDGTLRPLEEAPPLRALREGVAFLDLEEIVRTPVTGEFRYRSVSAVPIREEKGGVKGVVSIVRDITAQKRAAQELERMRLLMQEGERIAHLGSWEYVVATQQTVWSQGEYRIYGMDPAEPSPDYQTMLAAHIHPDHAERLDRTFREAFAKGAPFEMEHKIVRLDGAVREVKELAYPGFDSSGQLANYIGTTLDITERKQAEREILALNRDLERRVAERTEALWASETRFRTLFENNRSVMGLVEPETGKLLAVNQAAVDFYGYPREALLGMSVDQINVLPPEQVALERRRAVEQDKNYFQFVHRLADGSCRNVEVYSTPIEMDGTTLLFSIVHDVSARLRAERALRESQETLQRAQAVARIGSWWLESSPEHFGMSEETVRLFDLAGDGSTLFSEWLARVHPEDRAAVKCAWRAALRGAAYDMTYRIVVRGEVVWIKALAELEFDADGNLMKGVGTVQDITPLKQAELQIQRTAQRFQLATDAANIGVWEWNFEDGHLKWDDRLCNWYEVPDDLRRAGLYYDFWRSRAHPDDLGRTEASLIEARLSHAPWTGEFRILLSSGRIRHIQSAAIVERALDGSPIGMVGVNRDVTAQRALESSLRRAMLAAEAANRAKGDFLANMSHELRSPMNCILGMTGLVLETDLTPTQRDYLGKAQSASQALLRLLNDILDYSKIEAGHLDIEQRCFALADTVRNLTGLFAIRLEEKGLGWRVEIDPAVPAWLVGDDFRLSQVLVNLVGNAIKFTERGEVGLAIDIAESRDTDLTLRFTLQDTGIGMTPEQVEKLFESFTQADASTTRKYGGTGLGLAISKRLVELLDGRIEVRTEYGVGSAFVFTAGFRRAGNGAAPAPAVATLAELAIRARPIQGARILVVDDQASNLEYAEGLLKKLGLRAVCAGSGAEALARAEEERYAAVLMDIQMPGLDGYETARRISARLGDQAPPILAVTAAAMAEHRQASLDAGMVEHINKPIDPACLVDVLLQHVPPSTAAEAPLRPLASPAVERLVQLLATLERQLAGGDFLATRSVGEAEDLLAEAALAIPFEPVANAVKKLSYKRALRALEAFYKHIPTTGERLS